MRPYVFSCDAHIVEPPELFSEKMPAHLKPFVIHTRTEGNMRLTCVGDAVLLKMPLDFMAHKTGYDHHDPSQASVNTKRLGARDLDLRQSDMDRDGVDAELVFPTLGLMLPRIDDREAQRVACEIYNDWAWSYTAPVRERLIPAAMIPCIDFDDALAECKRTAAMGYAAFCLWEGLGNYTDPRWDPIFAFAGEQSIPIVFHTGVGNIDLRALRGPGGALFNYTRQMNDAVDIITQLVGGGVLDRNPKTHILFAEHSAGWLMGLAERMDEVYHGHAPSISPKLSRLPSQIVRDQVHCALQNDTGALVTRNRVGIDALLFATDYPHSEGTFPFSRSVVDQMQKDFPDVTTAEFVAVLGGNAAKLFKRANLAGKVEERARALTAA
jgi:predicted TIM-barrel fold metal-dependent hydrolase